LPTLYVSVASNRDVLPVAEVEEPE